MKLKVILILMVLTLGCTSKQLSEEEKRDAVIKYVINEHKTMLEMDNNISKTISIAEVNKECFEDILCDDSGIVRHWIYDGELTESTISARKGILDNLLNESLVNADESLFNTVLVNFRLKGNKVQIDFSWGSLAGFGAFYKIEKTSNGSLNIEMVEPIWVS